MSTLKTTSKSNGPIKELTILKIFFVPYIFICSGYMILNRDILTQAEGWGMVYMISLISCGLVGLAVDLILLLVIKKNWIFHLTEALLVFFFSVELWMELK